MSKRQVISGDPRRSPERTREPLGSTAVALPAFPPMGWQGETHAERPGRLVDLADIWRATVKHAEVVGLGLAVGLAIGAAATLLTQPSYTARATLQIDREAEKVVSSFEQTPVDNLSEEFYQTQYGLLKSRALSARVADSLDLVKDRLVLREVSDARSGSASAPRTAAERRDAVVDYLMANEGVSPERGSRLVTVTFDSPNAALSARIANAYAENFIKAGLDRRFESASYAREFLEERLAQVKTRLEDSERELVAYAARQQIIQLPNAGVSSANDPGPSLASASLESFNTALAAARTERIRAEQRWRQARASDGVGFPDILQSPTFQILSQEWAKLTADYQDKLQIFKPDYPDMTQLKARIDETQRQMELQAETVRQSLRAQYEAALANENALSGQVQAFKGEVLDLRGRSIRYTILQREVDTNRTLYDGLLQRYKEVGVAGGVASNNISIVDRAEPPRKPSHPRPLVNMTLAALGGLMLGVMLAFLREAFDQAVRAPADLEIQADLPLLGAIPLLKTSTAPKQALVDSRSPMAEAYHSLRSALQFSTADGFPRTLMITSPAPGGGKTTTAFALATQVAGLGIRVLLMDGDLRSPSVKTITGVEGEQGLSDLLTGALQLKEVVRQSAFTNLFIVTAGHPAPNPAELLGGSRLPILIAEAAAAFDMIIIDGPPIMGLADAPLIGAAVAGCLLIAEAGRTTRAQIRRAVGRMNLAGAHMLGTVLTKYKRASGAYGYGYGDVYGDYGYGAARENGVARTVVRAIRRIGR